MMKPKKVCYLLVAGLLVCFRGTGQNNVSVPKDTVLTLSYCQNAAIQNFPLVKNKALLQKASELKLENIRTNFLPQMNLDAQATYQSDAINITMPLPGNPISISQSKDQYKAMLDINQVIFDGRATHFQKLAEESATASDVQQVNVDLFKVREQVNNVYFLLLNLQQQKKLLHNVLDEIDQRMMVMTSSVRNGVMTPSDSDELEAQRLNTEQQLSDIDISRTTSSAILSILLNQTVGDSASFQLPQVVVNDTMKTIRPEYRLFDLQSKALDDQKNLLKTQRYPKLFAFGQAGYGRPGLNMLDNNFNPFYIVGITLKWNFFDWKKNTRERQALDVRKDMVETQRATFDKNLSMDLQNKQSVITKMENALQRDSLIVRLRSRIRKTAASRLDNGVITSTDYLTDLNAETNARINYETHKIQLVEAETNYLLAKGIY